MPFSRHRICKQITMKQAEGQALLQGNSLTLQPHRKSAVRFSICGQHAGEGQGGRRRYLSGRPGQGGMMGGRYGIRLQDVSSPGTWGLGRHNVV
jgi:hypothetical protein